MIITYTRFAIAVIIISLVLIIAASVINKLNKDECTQMIIPSYKDTLRSMHDFVYKDRACRFTAQSIVRYKINALNDDNHVSHKWNLNNLSDYALHAIMISDLLTDPFRISVVNHPQFVATVNDYDISSSQFYSDGTRTQAIDILLTYQQTEDDKNNARPKLVAMSDEQIYAALLHGYKDK